MPKPKNLDTSAAYSDKSVEDEFADQFPKTYEAVKAFEATLADGAPTLRTLSKRAGYWRGDIQHSGQQTDIPMADLKPHQVEAILEDPEISAVIIGVVPLAPAPEEPAK